MKKTNPIYQVTAGNPKKLKKPVIWTVVTNINLFSFMFLALFVITIYSFFAGDAGSLDIKTLWLSWGGISKGWEMYGRPFSPAAAGNSHGGGWCG